MTATKDDSKRDYRDTLFLPKTDFPMRAGLPKKEPEWLSFWNKIGLYERLREQSKDQPQYCLHDGPPYANGHIHMGTALNKIHKDLINRSHQMLGMNANYVPGWDCHGLPIEWKVEEEFRSKGRMKEDVKPSEFRTRCRAYANEWLDTQRAEFKRLGVVGDWDNPYVTMKFESEADICGELLKIAKTGQLYRGSKPIMWSPVEQTALAEAEVEYKDKKATQIYVKYPIRDARLWQDNRQDDESYSEYRKRQKSWPVIEDIIGANVVIWTTTPWTIPASQLVSYNKNIDYALYEVEAVLSEEELGFKPFTQVGERYLIAKQLADKVFEAAKVSSYKLIKDLSERSEDRDLAMNVLWLEHPLTKCGKFFDRDIDTVSGDHVTDETGTGFVHTAPAHGEDDFMAFSWTGRSSDEIVSMVAPDGTYQHPDLPEQFAGLDIIRTSGKKRGQDGKANAEVLKALVECGNLLARGMLTLRDAHSWRSKAPVIRRATPQWFISMSKGGLREAALKAIDETTFFPPRGKNRLRTMVEDRPDWLISRQRAWGVPITIIVGPNGELHTEREDADAINERILAAVRKTGVDGWFDTPLEELMPDNNEGWEKVNDILDVWFDSGSTHAFCLKQRDDLPDRADLYLEGSDQHRGWFQSSLLESCAVYGQAPYEGVMTDGFVVDEKGFKMSKSLGNTMSPIDIGNKFGADIMRLWVASSDVYQDLKIGNEIIQTNVDAYRKLRNTLRYMIGALDGFDEADAVDYADMPALEKWVLHRLAQITDEHEARVRDHDHKWVFSTLFNFCTLDLSAFYFDIRKDALYCDPLGSTRRRACRTVMNEIFLRLTTWLAPILSFTMEEVWQARFPSEDKSVHMELFREAPDEWKNEALAGKMETVREFRASASEAIEPLRKDKIIKSSLEARVTAPANDKLAAALTALKVSREEIYTDPANPNDTLADYLIISDVELSSKAERITIDDLKADSAFAKCERSWKYFKGDADITPRDAAAVAALG